MSDPSTSQSAAYHLFMLAVSIFALMALGTQVTVNIDSETARVLEICDDVVCAIFFVDFLILLKSSPNRWRYFVTFGWLDLISAFPVWDITRWGRLARVQRGVRVLRGFRSARNLAHDIVSNRSESTFLAAALISLVVITIGSISILQVEQSPDAKIRTAGDAVWWSIVTITTVGYGDVYPVTSHGRLIGICVMATSLGLFGTLSGMFAAWLIGGSEREKSEVSALRRDIAELRELLERNSTRPPS